MNKLQLQIVLYFVCATKNENDKITLEFYDIFMKLQKGGEGAAGGGIVDGHCTGHSLWPEVSSILCKLRLLAQLVEPRSTCKSSETC